MVRTLIAGNWKMNDAMAEVPQILSGLAADTRGADILICPPATLIAPLAEQARGTALAVGAQTCHGKDSGAHTGDLSATMLARAGASHVIVGHSERRADHGESDAIVAAQAAAARVAGLTPIICIGETLAERDSGQTLEVTARQLAGSLPDALDGGAFVVAYEPVWAIGTGRTPTPDQIGEVHGAIRVALAQRFGEAGEVAPVLYGGSMKPENASEILAIAHVNGGLIGGASLKARDFLAIYAAAAG